MWAFGWKLTDPTSPKNKFYTCVTMGNRVIINYGAQGANGQVKTRTTKDLASANGEKEFKDLLTAMSTEVYNEFMERHQVKKTYSKVDLYPVAVLIAGDDSTPDHEVVKNFVNKASSLTKQQNLSTMVAQMNLYKQKVTEAQFGKSTASKAKAPAAPPSNKLQLKEKFIRPNGEAYHARSVLGHQDVALLRRMRDKGIFVRLAGPPGAGKTALAEAAFGDVVTINGHGDMTVSHFAGSLLPTSNGGWEWADGPLTRAMKEGKVLFVDEITRIPTEVLAVLYSVMDGRGVLRLDDRPDMEPIVAKDGFYVITGFNPDTLGARALDEALTSRFRVGIEVTTDFDTAKSLNVPDKAIKLARNLYTRSAKDKADGGMGVWVPQMRELLTFRDLIDAGLDEEFALSALISSCPREEDQDVLIESAQNIFGYKDLHGLTLGRRF